MGGAVPVFRQQDGGSGLRMQAEATRSLIWASVSKIIYGDNMLVFPEGTRNKGDPANLGPLHKSVGRIAVDASNKVGVSILPITLWFGERNERGWLKPRVYLSQPLIGPFKEARQTVADLRSSMTEGLSKVSGL